MKFVIELTESENLELSKILYFAAINKDKIIEDLGDYNSEAAASICQKSLDAMDSVRSRD